MINEGNCPYYFRGSAICQTEENKACSVPNARENLNRGIQKAELIKLWSQSEIFVQASQTIWLKYYW